MTTSAQSSTCLILVAEGAALPEPLRDLLLERGFQPRVNHDPVMTMSELCLRERVHRARDDWDLEAEQGTVVVLAEPAPPGTIAEFHRAARRYLNHVEILTYHNGELVADERPPAASRPERAVAATGAVPSPEAIDEPEESTRITRREIDMLLDPPPGER
jgi:hypothetical protein